MLNSFILRLIFILLPTQLGKHFWPSFSYLDGFRIDYFSPTIYLVDIILLIYILLNLKSLSHFFFKHLPLTIFATLAITLNLLFSLSPLNSLVWFAHLLLYLFFVIILKIKKIKFTDIYSYFVTSLLLVCLLGFLQLLKQHSLDGLWYWLGERHLDLSMSQIAKFSITNQYLLRPYSLFSHPNSYAGYLFLSFLLLKQFKPQNKIIHILVLFSILLTGSKATLLTLVIYYLLKSTQKIVALNLATFTIITLMSFTSTNLYPDFIATRLTYFQQSKNLIAHYPPFGVGYGTYLKGLLEYRPTNLTLSQFQPVHHTLLLFISETGLFGLATLLYFLTNSTKVRSKIKSPNLANNLLVILWLSQMDHYFYTLPQNKLLLLLTLYFMVYNKKDDKNKST